MICSRYFLVVVGLFMVGGAFAGCSGPDTKPIPEAEQQKQIQELNQQRVDEWGNKAK
jgi:hypothetical protein